MDDAYFEEAGLIGMTKKLYDDAFQVLKRKNADYSGNKDTLKNFEVSAQIAKTTIPQGILTRLIDKVSRIGNLLEKKEMKGEVNDESILDTIEDLINYAAILHYAVLQEHRKPDIK